MADVGKEITPRTFQLVHLRHVARHHQQLTVGIRHNADFQMATVIQHQMQRLEKIAFFEVLGKFGVTQQVEDVLPAIVGPAKPQQLLGKAITPEDRPFFRGQHHGVWQRLGAATKAFNQISQLAATLFITQLHLVKPVQQRLPAAAPRRRRHTSIDPQPPRQTQQIPEMPDQQAGHCRQ